MEYISYQELPTLMGLEKGDIVLLSSDITDLFIQCKKHGENLPGHQSKHISFHRSPGARGQCDCAKRGWGEGFGRYGFEGDRCGRRRERADRRQHPLWVPGQREGDFASVF